MELQKKEHNQLFVYSKDNYLINGIENFTHSKCCRESLFTDQFITKGILILDSRNTSFNEKLEILNYSRIPGWCKIIIYDHNNKNEKEFVDFTGITSFEIHNKPSVICDILINYEQSSPFFKRNSRGIEQLSSRQWLTLYLSLSGLTFPEISEIQYRTKSTLYAHRTRALKKISMKNMLELIRFLSRQ